MTAPEPLHDRPDDIALADAHSGMVIANPILDKSGVCLMAAGTVLNEATIDALKRHDVMRIAVTAPRVSAAQHQLLEQALQRLDLIFQSSGESQGNQVLLHCLRHYRTGKTHAAIDQ